MLMRWLLIGVWTMIADRSSRHFVIGMLCFAGFEVGSLVRDPLRRRSQTNGLGYAALVCAEQLLGTLAFSCARLHIFALCVGTVMQFVAGSLSPLVTVGHFLSVVAALCGTVIMATTHTKLEAAVTLCQLTVVISMTTVYILLMQRKAWYWEARFDLIDTATAQFASRMEEKSKTTEQLVAAVSYAFRSPLNVVLGVAQRLGECQATLSIPEHTRALLQAMEGASYLLLNYIGNMLDQRCLEQGTVLRAMKPEAFSMRQVIGRAIGMLQFHARAKGISLDTDIAADVPDGVWADPVRLTQIVLNLATNAIKFTQIGGVIIRVRVESDTGVQQRCEARAVEAEVTSVGPDSRHVTVLRFEVVDTGPGMDDAMLARMLQTKYMPGMELSSSQEAGFGLGALVCFGHTCVCVSD
jgi:signal transduction histidine kinase